MPVTVQAEAPADLVELGRIVSAYGVRGWVKIQPHSSDSPVLLAAKTWWLKAPVPPGSSAAARPLFAAGVTNSRPQGATVVAQLHCVPDRDLAEALKVHPVWVPRADFLSAADEGSYWVHLTGCRLSGAPY